MKKTSRELEQESRRSLNAIGNLVERLTPWLLDVGSWIFGGMIASEQISLPLIMGAAMSMICTVLLLMNKRSNYV